MSPSTPENEERRSILKGLIGLVAACATRPVFGLGTDAERFPVYDALLFRGKPDLRRLGLTPMSAIAGVWRPGVPRDRVDEAGVVDALKGLAPDTSHLFVDIENWPLLADDGGVRMDNVDKYLRVAQIIRQTLPAMRFGFYGVAPICVYWPIVRQDPGPLASWRAVNRALRPLARWVDFVLPSLYTFYDDPAGWRQFALATIDEARQYGKPVYPFLLNEYFDGNVLLRGQVVKRSAWREELSLCRQHADGVVLWGGSGRTWSESADWWLSTRELLLPSAS